MARRIISLLIISCFCFEQAGFAQVAGQLDMTAFVARMRPTDTAAPFRPVHLRYVSYDAENEGLSLLLDKDDTKEIKPDAARESCGHLLEYFLTGLSLPGNFFWVNLRPDSPGKMIDSLLSKTAAGKILLEADLQLKKDTAAYTSPKTIEGREYWNKLYKKAEELFGSSDISIPTLTRPWIIPDEIIIRESGSSAYIYKATLKVMLEQDYLKDSIAYNFQDQRLKQLNEYASQLIRELIIPRIRHEVNSSKRYAALRQVYYSLILSQWFKDQFRNGQGKYAGRIDKKDLTGIRLETVNTDAYFQAYKKSFSEGEYNVRETISSARGQKIRNYFSGGVVLNPEAMTAARTTIHAPVQRDGGVLFRRLTSLLQARVESGQITMAPASPEAKTPSLGPERAGKLWGQLKEARASLRDINVLLGIPDSELAQTAAALLEKLDTRRENIPYAISMIMTAGNKAQAAKDLLQTAREFKRIGVEEHLAVFNGDVFPDAVATGFPKAVLAEIGDNADPDFVEAVFKGFLKGDGRLRNPFKEKDIAVIRNQNSAPALIIAVVTSPEISAHAKATFLRNLWFLESWTEAEADAVASVLDSVPATSPIFAAGADTLAGWFLQRPPQSLPESINEARGDIAHGRFNEGNKWHLLANYLNIKAGDAIHPELEGLDFASYYYHLSNKGTSKGTIGPEELSRLSAVAIEAANAAKAILDFDAANKKLGIKTIVVLNKSYGLVPGAAFSEERDGKLFVAGTDIEIWTSRCSSEKADFNDEFLPQNLFTQSQLGQLVRENIALAIVDGSASVKQRTGAHVPNAAKGFRNFSIAYSQAHGGTIAPSDYLVDRQFLQEFLNGTNARHFINRIKAVKGNIDPYGFGYWYVRSGLSRTSEFLMLPGLLEPIAPKTDLAGIKQKMCLFINTTLHPVDFSGDISDYVPGYYDDREEFKSFHLVYNAGKGLEVRDNPYVEQAREYFRAITAKDGGTERPGTIDQALRDLRGQRREIERVVLDRQNFKNVGELEITGQDTTVNLLFDHEAKTVRVNDALFRMRYAPKADTISLNEIYVVDASGVNATVEENLATIVQKRLGPGLQQALKANVNGFMNLLSLEFAFFVALNPETSRYEIVRIPAKHKWLIQTISVGSRTSLHRRPSLEISAQDERSLLESRGYRIAAQGHFHPSAKNYSDSRMLSPADLYMMIDRSVYEDRDASELILSRQFVPKAVLVAGELNHELRVDGTLYTLPRSNAEKLEARLDALIAEKGEAGVTVADRKSLFSEFGISMRDVSFDGGQSAMAQGSGIDSQRRKLLRRLEHNEGFEDFSLLVGEIEDEGFRNEILEFLLSEDDESAMYYKAKFVKNLLEKLNGDKVIFDFLSELAAEAPPEQRLQYFSHLSRFIYSGTIADIDDLQFLPEYIQAAGFLDDRDALRIFRFLSQGESLESENLRGYPLRGFPFNLKGEGRDDAARFAAAVREMINDVFDSGTIAGEYAVNPLAASIIVSAFGFNNDWGHKGIMGTVAEFMRRMNEASAARRIPSIDSQWSAIGRKSIAVRIRGAEHARRNIEQAGAEIYRFRQMLKKAADLTMENKGDQVNAAVREARAILETEISRLESRVIEHRQHISELERGNPDAVRAEAREILDKTIQAAGKNRKLAQEGLEDEKSRVIDELNSEKKMIAQGPLSLAFSVIERDAAQAIGNAEKRVAEYRALSDSLDDQNFVSLSSFAENLLLNKAVFFKLIPVLLVAEVFSRYPEKKKILLQADAGGFLQGLVEIRDVMLSDVLKDHPAQAKLMKTFTIGRLASIANQIGQVSQEPAVLSVFVTKDKFLGELASDIADVCYSYVKEVMAMPITAMIFSVEEEGLRQGAGSMLLLENTVEGRKTLILRALNPSDEYLARHSASDFVLAAFAYAKILADARGFEKIVVPFDVKNAMSNRRIRDEIERFIAPRPLTLDVEEKFNGFNITNGCREVLRSEIIVRAAARMSSGAGNYGIKKTDGGGIVNSTKKGNNGWVLLLNNSGHEIGQIRVLDDLPLEAGIGRVVGIKLGGAGETEEYITAQAGRIIEDAIRLGIHPVTALANQRFVASVLAPDTEVNEQRLSETVVLLLDDRGPRAFAYMDSGTARARRIPADDNVLLWTPQIEKGKVLVNDIFDRNLANRQRLFSFALKRLFVLYSEMKSRPWTLDDYDVTAKDGGAREMRTDPGKIPIEVLIDRMRKQSGEERGALNGHEPAAAQGKKGGIDFSSLPITRQRLSTMSAGAGLSSAALAMDLEREWRGMEKMIKGGLIPSAGRIGEFIAVCKVKGEMETYSDDVLAGIAGILRMEEAGSAAPTEAGFKEILFFLETDTVGAS